MQKNRLSRAHFERSEIPSPPPDSEGKNGEPSRNREEAAVLAKKHIRIRTGIRGAKELFRMAEDREAIAKVIANVRRTR
ncbi:hypothetical protein RF55_998 [Lasius niger]|uniref:Uncharacterized protein n=1 Tax=Lasius niger TaxID=67767 RepID=A0A0J7L878_LASNI|nr:hypothetical protein RF55_994 [Lasius niger]KMR01215.1 hypothetical protein RF55_998 [Lasius niger]